MAESAEGARLLSECRVTSSTEGSNPSLSAKFCDAKIGEISPICKQVGGSASSTLSYDNKKRRITDDRPQGVSLTVLRVKSMVR